MKSQKKVIYCLECIFFTMIKTRQKPIIVRFWQNLNQNWSVAVGFLVLLFILPVAVLVTINTDQKQTTSSSADSSKPIIRISPSSGQGYNQPFIIEVSDTNVDTLETVDLWFGTTPPSTKSVSGHYATISLQNYSVGSGLDWRANVYKTDSKGFTTNITTLVPDANISSVASEVYSEYSNVNAEIITSLTKNNKTSAGIKYQKVTKKSQNLLQFNVQVQFEDSFEPKDIDIYMKARRAYAYGGNTSSINNEEWTKVGIWNTSPRQDSPLPNKPPKIQSIPSSKSTVNVVYKYKISAVDPDGDSMTYSIFSSPKPAFLTLNGDTLTGTPKTTDVGQHSIIIMVADQYGNNSTQSWTINVVSGNQQTPTLTISSPKTGDKFTGTTNKITWNLSSVAGISNMKVSYASEGSTTYTAVQTLDASKTEFVWDSSKIANGKYTVKLEALDSTGTAIVGATSDVFTINNTVDDTKIQSPKLLGQTPLGTLVDRVPKITATIVDGSAPIDISTLKVTLKNTDSGADAVDITNKLDKSANTFTYTPSIDLDYGNYEVRVTVSGSDASGERGKMNEPWYFTISSNSNNVIIEEKVTPTNKIKLPLIGLEVDTWLGTIIIAIFVILLFGILVFAIFMLVKILKSKDDEMTQITKYYQQDNPDITKKTTITTDPFDQGGDFSTQPVQSYDQPNTEMQPIDYNYSNVALTSDPLDPFQQDQKFVQEPAQQDIQMPQNEQSVQSDPFMPATENIQNTAVPPYYTTNVTDTTPETFSQPITRADQNFPTNENIDTQNTYNTTNNTFPTEQMPTFGNSTVDLSQTQAPNNAYLYGDSTSQLPNTEQSVEGYNLQNNGQFDLSNQDLSNTQTFNVPNANSIDANTSVMPEPYQVNVDNNSNNQNPLSAEDIKQTKIIHKDDEPYDPFK